MKEIKSAEDCLADVIGIDKSELNLEDQLNYHVPVRDVLQAMHEYAAQFQTDGDRWVKVEDRLPEDSGDYLVIIKAANGTYPDIKEYDDDLQWRTQLIVTHWQPLPSKPKH